MSSYIQDRTGSALRLMEDRYRHASNATVAFATVSLASLLILGRSAYRDYKIYMGYGPGGMPYNVFGWLAVRLVLGPMCREVLSTEEYEGQEDKGTWLPEGELRRKGEAPIIGPHPVPQRQLNQVPRKEIQQKLVAAFDHLLKQNPDLVKSSLSQFERRTDALFVADSISDTPVQGVREVSHIHGTGEHSVHVILSPADCKKVIEGGWGQRHPLDGSKSFKSLTGLWIPNEYIFIYAPRDDEELETVMSIVRAAVGYMTGSREVR